MGGVSGMGWISGVARASTLRRGINQVGAFKNACNPVTQSLSVIGVGVHIPNEDRTGWTGAERAIQNGLPKAELIAVAQSVEIFVPVKHGGGG